MVVALEADVVRRAQDGDRAAFAELYDAYLPKIYDFALGMLRNNADAEDVVSETFLKAVERLRGLKDPDAFRGWLYAIARNSALDVIASRKRTVPTAEHDESAAPMTEASLLPEEQVMTAEVRDLVWSAAATLNPRDYQVFELTVRHGLGSAEIAEVLDVRPAYAYILANRLKASVEEALECVLLVRAGRDCRELDALAATYGNEPSPRMRKAVARHAKRCDVCAETKRTRASVPALLAGMAFAAPSAAFAAELASNIDRAWPPPHTGGGAPSGRSLAGAAGAVATILVLTVATVGATAQRTIRDREQVVEVEPAVEENVEEDGPTAEPSLEPSPGEPMDPAPTLRRPAFTLPPFELDVETPEPAPPPEETPAPSEPPRTAPPATRPPQTPTFR